MSSGKETGINSPAATSSKASSPTSSRFPTVGLKSLLQNSDLLELLLKPLSSSSSSATSSPPSSTLSESPPSLASPSHLMSERNDEIGATAHTNRSETPKSSSSSSSSSLLDHNPNSVSNQHSSAIANIASTITTITAAANRHAAISSGSSSSRTNEATGVVQSFDANNFNNAASSSSSNVNNNLNNNMGLGLNVGEDSFFSQFSLVDFDFGDDSTKQTFDIDLTEDEILQCTSFFSFSFFLYHFFF